MLAVLLKKKMGSFYLPGESTVGPSQVFDSSTTIRHNHLMRISLFFSAFLLVSCAPRGTVVQTPGDMPSANANVESAVIFVTSNTDLNLLPSLYSPTGGIAAMKAYFEIEKKELGERIAWFDASHIAPNLKAASGISATLQTPPTVLSMGAFKLGVFGWTKSTSKDAAKDPAPGLLEQATALRKQGADLVVVLTDLPIECRITRGFSTAPGTRPYSKPPLIRKADEPQPFCDGTLADALKSLPEGTINAAVVSGSGELQHFVFAQFSASKTAGIPIVASAARGTSGHLLYFSVSKTSSNTNFVPENTRIEGPFPIRTQGKFHGKALTPESDASPLQTLLAAEQGKQNQEKKEVLAHFNQEVGLDPLHESALADLAADALRAETHADFAIMPLGLFRNAERPKILPGPFSQADLNRLLPEATPVTTIEVSGEQLRTLFRISESGARGFSGISGTQLRLLKLDQQTPGTDLDGDGHIDLWELNRLLAMDDFPSEQKTYRLALPLALTQGADDWGWASQSMGLPKHLNDHSTDHSAEVADFRVLLADWLKQNPSVNFPAPRLKFEKVQAKNKHKRSGGHRRGRKRQKQHSA
jgi:5'-nucleotidase, C-terminal domain